MFIKSLTLYYIMHVPKKIINSYFLNMENQHAATFSDDCVCPVILSIV